METPLYVQLLFAIAIICLWAFFLLFAKFKFMGWVYDNFKSIPYLVLLWFAVTMMTFKGLFPSYDDQTKYAFGFSAVLGLSAVFLVIYLIYIFKFKKP